MYQSCNAVQARDIVTAAVKAGIVPLIGGSPGIGKSALVKSIADEYKLEMIDLRLAQCDPTDLLGFPRIDPKTGRADYAPMATFPLEGDPLPAGKDGWLLFLDEFTSADRSVQKAAYKLVLDGMVGQRKIHPKVAIVAAGNLITDNAIVEEMSTALQSRVSHLEMHAEPEAWLDWAMRNNVDHHVTDFIKWKPGMLYTFDPHHTDKTYACPRTWVMASRLKKVMGDKSPLLGTALAGTLSQGVATEFLAFVRIYASLPDPQTIIANPKLAPVPTEPGHMFALTGSLAHYTTPKNVGQVLTYLDRMPIEFQVVCLKDAVRRNKAVFSTQEVTQWVASKATDLFA